MEMIRITKNRGETKMKELNLKVGKLEDRGTKLGLCDPVRFCAVTGTSGIIGAIFGFLLNSGCCQTSC